MPRGASRDKKSALGAGLDRLLERSVDLEPETADLPATVPDLATEPKADGTEPTSPPPDTTQLGVPQPAGAVSEGPQPAPEEPNRPEAALPRIPPLDTQERSLFVEDAELFHAFLQESTDHLSTIEDRIIQLESVKDLDNVNAVFRCMHTIKGNSSFLGLTEINRLSHRLESVLDGLRNGSIDPTPEIIDVLLSGSDALVAMIGDLEAERKRALEENPSAVSIRVIARPLPDPGLIARVERVLGAESTRRAAERTTAATPAEAAPTAAPPPTSQELVTDEIAQRFKAESLDLLDVAERALLDLERNPGHADRVDEAFRALHTIKGNAGFMGFANIETVCMKAEAELDHLRTGERRASASFISALLAAVDTVRSALGGQPQEDTPPPPTALPKPVGEILVDLGETTPEDLEQALSAQERRVGEILVAQGKLSPAALQRALSMQKRRDTGTDVLAERKDIRVDTTRLDKLFDLMGELITAQAMVIHNPEIQGLELAGFSKSATYLSKITRELQEITLTIRMIPLEGLFNKMRRLVRDLARKSGKTIEFVVSGQETEMDRNVMEEISDPLVHLIRNAIDHGIEGEEGRKTRGKPAAGRIGLSARYEGNEIWVTVSDDGEGLDRERILAKAAERGTIAGDPGALTDDEVWAMVFEPGFSTAAKVTEVSGRGVGMDVVKRNMDRLRGKADITTRPGSGTEITLKIPLTLAIIDGVSVRVGSVVYEIPLADVVLFHKATAAEITRTTADREVVRLRGSLIPVIKLHDFFRSQGAAPAIPDGILVVTQRGGGRAALLADEIVGYQQIVVKALPRYLAGLKAISGCSIHGNGDVSLIVDTGALIKAELQ